MLHIAFSSEGWEDYLFWQKNDKKTLKKTNQLIEDIRRHPFEGLGKPEPLKGDLSSYWSRRINLEHRIIYTITEDTLLIIQCRYHY